MTHQQWLALRWHPIAISIQERRVANQALRAALQQSGAPQSLVMKLGTGPGSVESDRLRDDIIEGLLAAINLNRCGQAEGSVAKSDKGHLARRYYDAEYDCLRWLVFDPGSTEITASRQDQLEGEGWTLLHSKPWKVLIR